MIFVGIGANLSSSLHGDARHTCEAALASLGRRGVLIRRQSSWYRTAPVPISDQPWYVNGVVGVETDLAADHLLTRLHEVENEVGRVRVPGDRNAARVLDLDLLDYAGQIRRDGRDSLILPHPRMHQRAFVLVPLRQIAANWRHPASGLGIDELIDQLPGEQVIEPLAP